MSAVCLAPDCARPIKKRGLCGSHYSLPATAPRRQEQDDS